MSLCKIIFLALISLSLIGCGKNPLLGTWKVKPEQNQMFIVCPEITFTQNISKCGSIVEEVSYEIQGSIVIVRSELGDQLGMKVAYEIKDQNTMVLEMPVSGKLIYGRASY